MSASDPASVRGCEVYWGSHGCDLARGHDGYCRCDCSPDPADTGDGAYPYFGPETLLYGRDVEDVWGLDGAAHDDSRPISESPRWQKDHSP